MVLAGVHPTDCARPTTSEAGRKVHAALKRGLPDGWVAWHSLRVRDRHEIGGEGDFVIVAPARGLLVLEVKGGRIEQRDGRWFQNGRAMEPAPRDQAEGFVRKLVGRLRERGCAPPAFGVATCFPDTEFDRQPDQDDMRGRVLGAQDLPWLADALASAIESTLPPAQPSTGRWIDELHALWGETWTPRLSLGRRSRMLAEQRVALDARQLELLDLAGQNERVLVEGGAGTGKTLVALEAARRFAAQGRRPLLLCFTSALGGWLAREVEGTGVEAINVRKLAKDVLTAAGADIGDLTQAETWEALPTRAAEALARAEHKWDAVVVDEAQDFSLGDWALVDQLAGGGWLWAFCDPQQAFWENRSVERSLFATKLQLRTSYRTPPELLRVANAYAAGEPDPAAVHAAVAAGQLAIITAPAESAVPAKVATEIDKLLSDGLTPGDIAVISLRGRSTDGSVIQLERVGRHELVAADDEMAEEHVVADTFLRFKGLERAAVIVTDLRLVEDKKNVRMHIALTRALATARIVAPAEALRSDSMLPSA
jgi:hypothetical protein